MGRKPHVYPHLNLWKNLEEVQRLLDIHTKVAGKKPGRKHNVEVLNKSAIVLLVACWEAFVEDLAEDAFSILLRRAKTHSTFPAKVLSEAARPLHDSKNPCDIWRVAGAGWKTVLKEHKAVLFERYTGKLNTPRPTQVDAIYEALLGMKAISDNWHWGSTTADRARAKLDGIVGLRGSIAHRVAAARSVQKKDVRQTIDFINRIAVCTSNAAQQFLLATTGKEPWPNFKYDRHKRLT